MSWSVSAVGRASAVAAMVDKALAAQKCSEPEESIKAMAAVAIATALAAFPESFPVRVEASGSQGCPDSKRPHEKVNNLVLKIDPIWGFL